MSIQGNPFVIHDSNLVLNLDAGNPKSYPGSGGSWYDLSGNMPAGVLGGSIDNIGVGSAPSWSSGNGGYLTFSGGQVVTYYQLTNTPLNITNNITLESWVYITGNTNYGGIFNFGTTGGEQYSLNTMSNQKFSVGTNWPGTWYLVSSTGTYTNNVWTHIVATFSSNTLLFYINGVLDTSTTLGQSSFTSVSNAYLVLGDNHPGGQEYLSARMAVARIYNRVLTGNEILQNYNAVKSRFGL